MALRKRDDYQAFLAEKMLIALAAGWSLAHEPLSRCGRSVLVWRLT